MPVADVLTALADHKAHVAGYSLYRDYEEGRHRYPFASPVFRSKFRWVLDNARANMCPRVRANFSDLVTIQGWDGPGGDDAAALAGDTSLGTVLNLAWAEAFRTGDAYVLVWPGKDGDPRAWYHRADQITYRLDPENPDEIEWAAKIWVDGDQYGRVNVYYRDVLERWQTVSKVRYDATTAPTWPESPQSWAPCQDDTGDTIPHQFGRVPLAHFAFDATEQGGRGRSILRDVIPLQDMLNHALTAGAVNIEQYAAPLRALMEHVPEKRINPATGQAEAVPFVLDETHQRMVAVASKGPLIQLDPADSSNLITLMDAFGAWMARIVGMPPSDIVPDLGNVPSGAALRILAAARTAAVENFTTDAEWPLTNLLSLLGVEDAHPIWVSPAPRDETEQVEGVTARVGVGMTLEDALVQSGVRPEDAERIALNAAAQDAQVLGLAREATVTGTTPAQVATTSSADDVKLRADAMGVLIRAGVKNEDAANQVGLNVDFVEGARPITIRTEG